MRAWRRCLRTAAVAALALGVVLGAHAQHIPGTAARVNGTEITNFRLERHFEEYLAGQRRHVSSMINPRVYKKLKREALDQLIERELLWQAARGAGVTVPDDDVRAALQALQAQLKSREAFLHKLEQAGFDEPRYADYVRQALAGTKYLQVRTAESSAVSDTDVAAYYANNRHRFQQPESVRARHILLRLAAGATPEQRAAARAKLEHIRAELLDGADFADLARRYSEDTSASAGGGLGVVARGRMVKAFDEALFALAPGAVSEVIQTHAGLHVIRADERFAAGEVPLDDVRASIRARLADERRARQAREIVERLRAAAAVDVLVQLD